MSQMPTPSSIAKNPVARATERHALTRAWLCVPAITFLLFFFVLPLLQNAVRSIVSSDGSNSLTLVYYRKLLGDPYYLSVVLNTLKVSVVTTLLCVVIGYPIAYFLVRRAGRWSSLFLFILVAPLLTSIIMRTFGWRVLLARTGIVNRTLLDIGLIDRPLNMLDQPFAVYMGLVHVMVPFMVLSIAPVLQGIDRRLEESARILGASARRTFLTITLPLTIEGLATGSLLVFMLTNGSFVTMLLLGGGRLVTLPLLIFQQFSLTTDVGFASAMGNLLLVIVLVCLYVQLRLSRGKN